MYDLTQMNLENDMYVAISDYYKLHSDLLSKYVFNNINGTRHYPILKFISMINKLANDNTEKTKPLIIYSTNGQPIYLND